MSMVMNHRFYLTSEGPNVDQNPLPSTEMSQRTIKTTLKGNSFPRYSLQSENKMSHYLSFSADTNASTCCLVREVTERWELHIRVAVSEAMMLSRRENGQVQSNLRTRAVRLWTSSLCSLMRLHLSNFKQHGNLLPNFY